MDNQYGKVNRRVSMAGPVCGVPEAVFGPGSMHRLTWHRADVCQTAGLSHRTSGHGAVLRVNIMKYALCWLLAALCSRSLLHYTAHLRHSHNVIMGKVMLYEAIKVSMKVIKYISLPVNIGCCMGPSIVSHHMECCIWAGNVPLYSPLLSL